MHSLSLSLSLSLSIDLYGSFRKLGDDGEMDLMSFVRRTMFDSVVRQLFGADNVPETETGMRELERKFVKFDEDFEYGTQLPEFLIRSEKFSRADHLKLNHPPKNFHPGTGVNASTGFFRSSRKWLRN